MMNSTNLIAWSDPSSGFVSDLEDVLYTIGCWEFTSLSTCDSSDCMWDGNACKPTVTAVQSKMTATGANAAVSEYAVHEALEYVCPTASDQATCEDITGCRFDDFMVLCGVDYEYALYEVATACGTDLTSEDKELIALADDKSSWAAIESMATGSWPDLAAFCDLYRSYEVCDGNDEQACPTTSPYDYCTWDGQTGCNMKSADYDAWYGVYCNWDGSACGSFDSHPQHDDYCALRSDQTACFQSSSSLTHQMRGFLSGDSGCGSLSDDESACNQNQNCAFSYSSCEPLVAAVNASMLSTGAHAAITEYAIAEKRRYTCQTLDASTCSSVDGCQYYGCSGTSSANAASCSSRDGTTCEEYNCVWSNSDGTCSGNHMDCPSATTQFECERGLENNCHWSGCGSSSDYGIIRVATACGTEYDPTDLDYIAQANHRSSWDQMISGSSGSSGPPEDVDFCMAWVNVTACDVADAAGATNCPSSLCEFVDGTGSSSPTCTPTSASVDAWNSEKSPVTSLLTASPCGQYDSSVDNCNAEEGCFHNGSTCEPTPQSAFMAVMSAGGTNAMRTLAIAYSADEAGYCDSLSETECGQVPYCSYDGTSSSCVMVPNFDVAFIGGACEEVSSSSATVAAGLNSMLSVLAYSSFTELQETIMAGGGGRRRRRGPAAAWRGLAAAAAWRGLAAAAAWRGLAAAAASAHG
jgi:hypothetical protein